MISALGIRWAALAALVVTSCLLAGPLAARADASLDASPTEVTFDDRVVADGPGPAHLVTFDNSGDVPVTFGRFDVTGDSAGAFTVSNGDCPAQGESFAAGATCSVTVSFDPPAAGPHAAKLTIVDPAPTPGIEIVLQGFAIEPAISVDPSSTAFQAVEIAAGPSAPGYFRIQNTGSADLAIGAAAFIGPDAADFALTEDGCFNRVLQPSVFCDIAVVIDPSSPGPKNAALRFTHNAAGGVTELPLSATAFVFPFVPMLTQRAKTPRLSRVKRLVFIVKCPAATCHVTATANLYLPVAGRKKTRRSTLGWKQKVVTGGGKAKIAFRLTGRQRYAVVGAARRGIAVRGDAWLNAWSEGYTDVTKKLSFKIR